MFRTHYNDNTITKDEIFDYIYGILHAPSYRERFSSNLTKEMPRIPMAVDFYAFAKAGTKLAELHLGYETCKEYPLETVPLYDGDLKPEHFRIGARAMRYADEGKTILNINDHIQLKGIPAEAHRYKVSGRTPMEWFIDRYKVTKDKETGILKDPNGWFNDPEDLIKAFQRIVHVSVETARIIGGLPEPFNADGRSED